LHFFGWVNSDCHEPRQQEFNQPFCGYSFPFDGRLTAGKALTISGKVLENITIV
jgi:hypothetical protein